MLLGGYESSDEEDTGPKQTPTLAPAQGAPLPKISNGDAKLAQGQFHTATKAAVADLASRVGVAPAAVDVAPNGRHGAFCECEDCEGLLARFVAKNLQTKGIRFKCKLCSELVAKKADAADHFTDSHGSDLQTFKRQKQPKLFEPEKKKAAVPKISFARDDVLGKKRKIDEDDEAADDRFGGWTKKEKPELPPCEQPGYQEEMMEQEEVFTAPPWMNKPAPLQDDTEATDTEKVVDQHVTQAQVKRFTSRNVLEVKKDIVRCKLCYKTHKSTGECEKHIIAEHRDEFNKELEIWHRFLYTYCKRQPPFGWVCKICNLFFPTDKSTFRHIGKEIHIRREEKHADQWREKEDRWGHEADQECCGDGMNVAKGLSYESVKLFNEQAARLQERELAAKALEAGKKGDGDSDSGEDAPPSKPVGSKSFIEEF